MRHNKKFAELVLWIVAAVISIILFASSFNSPKKPEEGGEANVNSVRSQYSQLQSDR